MSEIFNAPYGTDLFWKYEDDIHVGFYDLIKEQDLYNTDMGSHYIGGQYGGTIGFIKEVLQDALFMDAMVSSGVALQGQDTFDAVMSNTNQNSVISDSSEIQETIKQFIKYLEEGRSK